MNVVLVNRDAEKALVEDALKALDNYKEELLLTPILDFYGIEGIGKTSMIDYVEKECQKRSVPYIRIDGSKDTVHFLYEVISQLKKYNIRIASEDDDKHLFEQSAEGTKVLLEQGVAVMLLDAVDPTNKELLERIAAMLREVIEENKLFVVLTSRRNLLFDTERSVARKLTSFQLKPFNQKNSEAYLQTINAQFEPEIRNYIFDWTKGYPLAMQVMARVIIDKHLDPRNLGHQKELLKHIVEKVIDGRVLARVRPDFFHECRSALTLFSIPRRFNIVIMKALIEEFNSKLKQLSGVAYMNMPRMINQNTDVLNWNIMRAGFSVNDPVRTLFFLKSRIEDPELHLKIHGFLARLNKQIADEVHGLDRMRYLREYLYHSAHTETARSLAPILEQTTRDIIADSPEAAEQFYEEFKLDEELNEVLGEQKKIILSQVYRYLAEVNRQLARESWGTEHIQRIQEFFYNVVEDPQIADLRTVLQRHIENVLTEEPVQNIPTLTNALLNDSSFKESLGRHFELFALLLQEYLSKDHTMAAPDIIFEALASSKQSSSRRKKQKADLVLVTVTPVETEAILARVSKKRKVSIGNRAYHDLDTIGGAKTFLVQLPHMGSGGSGGSLKTIEAAIQALSPWAVIMVGIAFGFDPANQRIGDILISQQIQDYDLERVGSGPGKYPRGNRVSASASLLSNFITSQYYVFEDWPNPPKVYPGLILSGSKLVDDEDFRNQLHMIAPNAVGGEMEGVGLYEAALNKRVEWLLVKAISDWADGKNT